MIGAEAFAKKVPCFRDFIIKNKIDGTEGFVEFAGIPGASDSARYKALGNSFAIPNIYFVISRIKEVSHEKADKPERHL